MEAQPRGTLRIPPRSQMLKCQEEIGISGKEKRRGQGTVQAGLDRDATGGRGVECRKEEQELEKNLH